MVEVKETETRLTVNQSTRMSLDEAVCFEICESLP
jgi:hypothetical protein